MKKYVAWLCILAWMYLLFKLLFVCPKLIIAILMLEQWDRERECVIWTRKEWKDGEQRDNKAAGATNTYTFSSSHTHTHTHAWLTYVWKPSHVCMRGRHHVKWASVHVKHAASGKWRTRQRERTEDTLLLLSTTISVFLLTHTLARRLITLPTVYVQQQDSSRHGPDPAKGHTHTSSSTKSSAHHCRK